MQAVVEVATKLNLTPAAATLRFLLQPKKFDRIFHMIFDPEFTIDQEKTEKTVSGKNKLKNLIDSGKVAQKRRTSFNTEYIDADKNPDDTTMESFFVVAETHSPKLKITENLLSKLPDSFLKATGTPLSTSNKDVELKGDTRKKSPRPFNIPKYFK